MQYEILIITSDGLKIRSFTKNILCLKSHLNHAMKCEGGRDAKDIIKIVITEINHAIKTLERSVV